MTREVTPTMPQPPENYCRYGNLSVSTKTTTFLKPMDLGYSTLAHQNPPSVLLRSRAENRRRTVRPSWNAQKCRETSDFWRLWWSGLNSWVASVMWAAARSASTTNLGGRVGSISIYSRTVCAILTHWLAALGAAGLFIASQTLHATARRTIWLFCGTFVSNFYQNEPHMCYNRLI